MLHEGQVLLELLLAVGVVAILAERALDALLEVFAHYGLVPVRECLQTWRGDLGRPLHDLALPWLRLCKLLALADWHTLSCSWRFLLILHASTNTRKCFKFQIKLQT